MIELQHIVTLDFGATLTAAIPVNWDVPDGDRRWARGIRSILMLPRPKKTGDLAMLLTVDPFILPPLLLAQKLSVFVNGTMVGRAHVRTRLLFACLIESSLIADRDQMEITFEHPNVVRPNMVSASSDSRSFSIAFVNLTLMQCNNADAQTADAQTADAQALLEVDPPLVEELSDAKLMSRFASIGDNCEFGLVQRGFGAEPMDLLRFAGSAGYRLPGMLRGLDTEFADVERFQDLEFELYPVHGGLEYVLHHRSYQFQSHTAMLEGATAPGRLYIRERRKLALLRKLFMDDILSTQRIFVYKSNDARTLDVGLGIIERLRRKAAVTLLFVIRTDSPQKMGTVENHGDGLLVGYIDRFNQYDDANAPASPLWLPICRSAYRLWRALRNPPA